MLRREPVVERLVDRADSSSWRAFDDESVERVERADQPQGRVRPPWALRVHILEMGKVRAVLRVAMHRQRMHSLPPPCARNCRGSRPISALAGEGGLEQQAAGQHGNSLGRCGLGGAAGSGGSPGRANHILDHTDRAVSRLRPRRSAAPSSGRAVQAAPAAAGNVVLMLIGPSLVLPALIPPPFGEDLPAHQGKAGASPAARPRRLRRAMSRWHAGLAGRAVAGVRTPC